MSDPTPNSDIDRLVERLLERLPQPVVDTEPRVMRWLSGVTPTFVALFGFGGQITFTIIPTITDNAGVPFYWTPGEVRTFLALAWLFFSLGLGLSCSIVFSHIHCKDSFKEKLRPGDKFESSINVLTELLELLAAAAFFFLSLVVIGYSPVVGWVALAICSWAVLGGVYAVVVATFLYVLFGLNRCS